MNGVLATFGSVFAAIFILSIAWIYGGYQLKKEGFDVIFPIPARYIVSLLALLETICFFWGAFK